MDLTQHPQLPALIEDLKKLGCSVTKVADRVVEGHTPVTRLEILSNDADAIADYIVRGYDWEMEDDIVVEIVDEELCVLEV